MNEVYVSIDIEADGPLPGMNSMLQLGASAFDASGRRITGLSVNLKRLRGATQNPDTMAWWKKQGDAYEKTRVGAIAPSEAAALFGGWLSLLKPSSPICVAFPAAFDWPFINYYLTRFKVRHPLNYACIDLKSFAMALLPQPYLRESEEWFPKEWYPPKRGPEHDALSDAIYQGELFMRMLAWSRRRAEFAGAAAGRAEAGE